MALTALKIQELTDRGFPDLYAKHTNLWREKAKEAYEYTEKFVTAAGQRVRPDDVIDLLIPALELSDEFRTFLEDKRLRQKYWRRWFGELILDELWVELSEEEKEEE
jgi:hypothetical protein